MATKPISAVTVAGLLILGFTAISWRGPIPFAHANTTIIVNSTWCSGTGFSWNSATNTCILTTTYNVGSAITIEVPLATTLVIEPSGSIFVTNSQNSGGILAVDNGGTLNVTCSFSGNGIFSGGAIYNSGTFNVNSGPGGSFCINNDAIITNSGMMNISGSAIGIGNYGGTLTNSGKVNVHNSGDQGIANVKGGTISNSGTIIVNNTATGAFSTGITNAGSTITNSGTINVTDTSTGSFFSNGISSTGSASIANSGTINVNNTSHSAGIASNATITNSGTINVFSSGSTSTGYAVGIDNYNFGKVSNLVTINIDSTGGFGNGLDNRNNATITNSGMISIDTIGTTGLQNSDNATLTNSGTIAITSSGSGSSFVVGLLNYANITNYHSITVNNSGGIGLSNQGKIAEECGATITGSGTITGNPIIQAPGCPQHPPGLAHYWPANGNAVDVVGGDNGTLINGAGFAPGIIGQAFNFTGAGQYVQTLNPVPFGSANFTIDLWANFNAVPSSSATNPCCAMIADDPGPVLQDKWWFAVGGGILFFHINSPSVNCNGAATCPLAPYTFSPNLHQWYNLAVSRSSGNITIYVDGVKASSQITSYTSNPTVPLTIGFAEAGSGYFNGLIDEVQIYNRALSPSEIAAIHENTALHTTVTYVNCDPSPVAVGSTAGCNVKVVDQSSNPTNPTGTVTLTTSGSGTVTGSPCTLVPVPNFSNVSVCQNLPNLPNHVLFVTPSGTQPRTDTITATYNGDATDSGSSATFSLQIGTDPTTAVVSCIPNTVLAGATSTCTITVTDTATGSGQGTPTGTVSVTSSGTGTITESPCSLTGSGAVATCPVAYTPTGTTARTDTITATYSGDSSHATSTNSAQVSVTAPIPFDYTLSVNPSTASLVAGSSTTATISATLTSGTAQAIALIISNSPNPAVCQASAGTSPCGSFGLSQSTITPTSIGATSVLTISTTGIVPPGTYTITIKGSPAGSSSNTAIFTLTISPPSISNVSCGRDLTCSVQSNATLSNIKFAGNTIHVEADGPHGAQGYANVTVPKSDVPHIDTLHVFVDNNKLSTSSVTITSNSTTYFIYFTFTFHSPVKIDIQLSAPQQTPNAPTILGIDQTLFYEIIGGVIAAIVIVSAVVVVARRRKTRPMA